MGRLGRWRTAGKYFIQVFGRGNLRRSSWFENYLSIDPFDELILTVSDRVVRHGHHCDNSVTFSRSIRMSQFVTRGSLMISRL